MCLSAHTYAKVCLAHSSAERRASPGKCHRMPNLGGPRHHHLSDLAEEWPPLCALTPRIVTLSPPPQESWFHRKAACLAPGRRPAAVPSPTLAGRDSYPAAAASPFEHLSQHPLSASFLALWNASPQHWPQPPWSQQQAKGQGRQPPASSDNPLALRLAINWPCTDLCGPWRDCLVGFGSSECPRANQRQGQVRLSLLAF